jgi:hypothetical protein
MLQMRHRPAYRITFDRSLRRSLISSIIRCHIVT